MPTKLTAWVQHAVLFTFTGRTESQPPTRDAFLLHLRGVCFQTSIWKGSQESTLGLLS